MRWVIRLGYLHYVNFVLHWVPSAFKHVSFILDAGLWAAKRLDKCIITQVKVEYYICGLHLLTQDPSEVWNWK